MAGHQLLVIQNGLRRLGWSLGHTSCGILAICGTRRIHLDRGGRVDIEDIADTDANIIRRPHEIDAGWEEALSIVGVKPESVRRDGASGRWTTSGLTFNAATSEGQS